MEKFRYIAHTKTLSSQRNDTPFRTMATDYSYPKSSYALTSDLFDKFVELREVPLCLLIQRVKRPNFPDKALLYLLEIIVQRINASLVAISNFQECEVGIEMENDTSSILKDSLHDP